MSRLPMRGLCLLVCATVPLLAANRIGLDQLREMVAVARAAGVSDQEMARRLAGVQLKERFMSAGFPEGLGPLAQDRLRILAAESAFLGPPAANTPGNPPPLPETQAALLARIRGYTLHYIRDLPDFVCTRTTHRYDDLFRPGIQARDISSSELTYNRGQESDAPRIVDRPTCGSIPEGLASYGEFGSIIAALFADGGGASLAWSHWEILSSRLLAVFTYAVDPAHSNYTITWCCRLEGRLRVPDQFKTPYAGEISVDPDTGAILRVTRRATPPKLFPNHRTDTVVEYQPVEVDGKSYLCPMRSVTVAESTRPGTAESVHYVNEMLFTDYHKFVASAVLSFTAPPGDTPAAVAPLVPPARPGAVAAAGAPVPTGCALEPKSQQTPKKQRTDAAAASAPEPRAPSDAHFRVLRFSPDGQYVLAQDDAGIVVFNAQPFRVRFRLPAENATAAEFTPDSRQIVFLSSVTHADRQHLAFAAHPAHVERWSIADRKRTGFTEMSLQTCDTVGLSPDGLAAACVDFSGTLRLLDAATGAPIFEKPKFGRQFQSAAGVSHDTGDPGSAQIEFSPDGRFVIAAPLNAMGSAIAWDLREKHALSLMGPLKDLHALSFAFAGAGRILVSRTPSGWRNARNGMLVAFPSGEILSKPALPVGALSRATDPGYVLVRAYVTVGIHDTPPPVQAIGLRTAQTITNETAALDVLGNRYVAQRADGELELYENVAPGSPGDPIELGKVPHDAIVRTTGQLTGVDRNRIVVATNDRREVTFLVSSDTKFYDGTDALAPRDIRAGQFVDVESTETDDEQFQAIKVTLRSAPAPTATPVTTPPAEPFPTFLREARAMAGEQSESLPDYTCVARVARYRSDNHVNALWRLEDVVSAEIVRQDGRAEQHQVIRNGKSTDPERAGNRTWSAGDFNMLLADILSWSSAARISYLGDEKLGKIDAVRYAFRIDAAHSHWQVQEGGQTIRPARTGTIWFDSESRRVLRIEFQGVDIPRGFPSETLELAIDYDYVDVDGEKVLLPVRAEQLGCLRGVAYCTKNTVEFRDYHGL